MRAPNLFLIGAQKGGSTSLARHLAKSPDIAFARSKELNIFSLPTPEEVESRLRALDLGEEPGCVLDASVDYARYPLFPDTAAQIRRFAGPEVRILYLIRNPVNRTISHYEWSRQRYGETLPFLEAIEADDRYVAPSRYDMQLDQYFGKFDPDRIRVTVSERYFADQQGVAEELCDWLGVRPPAAAPTRHMGATAKSTTRAARFPVLNRIVRQSPQLKAVLQRALPNRTLMAINTALSKGVPRERISETDRRYVMDRYFAESVRRTEQMTGLDLSAWKRDGTSQE